MDKVKMLARGSGLLKEGAQAKLEQMNIVVVGAGAIGSWAALGLAKMGCENVTFYENDLVEIENYNNQLYGEKDIKKHKLDALKSHLTEYPTITKNWKYEYKFLKADIDISPEVLILGVDSIDARRELFDAYRFNDSLKLIKNKTAK